MHNPAYIYFVFIQLDDFRYALISPADGEQTAQSRWPPQRLKPRFFSMACGTTERHALPGRDQREMW
jgi:hypothetical protein